jgi:hypothetical protein
VGVYATAAVLPLLLLLLLLRDRVQAKWCSCHTGEAHSCS